MTQVGLRRVKALGVSLLFVLALAIGIFPISRTSADALINYSSGNVTGDVEDVIDLPGITVSGTDPTIPLILEVDDPNGILYMTDETNITFQGANRANRISFSGSVADLNNALATLKYRTLSAGTWTVTATVLGAGVVYFPGNGHLYEVIDHGSGLSWDDAAPLAAARTMNGATGYLATVTSQAENDYLLGRLQGDGWFGASDVGTEGDWKWVTGPEAGTSFWAGLGDGSAVGGLFSNWASGEPNDAGGEDCAQFYSSGSGWNDLPCNGPFLSYYVVEYGGPGDMPTAPDNVTFDVTVSEPSNDVIPIGSCLDLLDVADNPELDNRYDTLSLTTNVDCTGETLTPMYDDTDTDFGVIGFRGTVDGNGFSLTNVSMNNPSGDEYGLFSTARDSTFQDITIGGDFTANNCVGALVGVAINSTFTGVTSTANVTGWNGVGGIVGCLDAQDNYNGSMTTSSASGDVNGSDRVGGLIGEFEAIDSSVYTVNNNDASNTVDTSSWSAGGLIGSLETDDTARVTIYDNSTEGINSPNSEVVGGIVGYLYLEEESTIEVYENEVTGAVLGDATVGGFIGEFSSDTPNIDDGILRNSTISVTVSSDDGDNVGGLIGYADDITVSRSSNSGAINGADDETGGLVGEASDVRIEKSFSTGTVTGSDGLVGGLVGRNSETTIERSYATGNVSGEDRVGGLVGANGGYIIDSYARGDVTANSDQAGGLAGRCGREITRSYATGAVAGSSDVGGLIGYSDGCDVVDSFWDMDTSLQATSDGDETGKTTAEMKDVDTFTDTNTVGLDTTWNFASVWSIATTVNDGYPCLQWQSGSCVALNQEDDDEDGVTSAVEDAAPNGGDANNDGTPDSEQTHVSSFVNPVSNNYAVVETDSACSLSTVSAESEDAKSVKDSGYDYASGLLNFTANCGTAGYTTNVRLILFNKSASNLVMRKFNPNTGAYFTITDGTIQETVIGGIPAVLATYQLRDGGTLDTDGVVNGVIVDPVGLAAQAVGVPNTGFRR